MRVKQVESLGIVEAHELLGEEVSDIIGQPIPLGPHDSRHVNSGMTDPNRVANRAEVWARAESSHLPWIPTIDYPGSASPDSSHL